MGAVADILNSYNQEGGVVLKHEVDGQSIVLLGAAIFLALFLAITLSKKVS